MRIQTFVRDNDFHLVHRPKLGARIVGAIFLGFGGFFIAWIVVDTFKKVSSGNFSTLFRSLFGIVIVLAMAGFPGLLFGFQTNRLRINRAENEIVVTKDFVVRRFRRRFPADAFVGIELAHRVDLSMPGSDAGSCYDLALVGYQNQREEVDTFFAQDIELARRVAQEIANYLHIKFMEPDSLQ